MRSPTEVAEVSARPSDVVRLPVVDRVVHWLADNTPVTVDQVQVWIVNGLRTALEFAMANSKFVFLGALGALVGLFLMLFILYFFFRDGEEIVRRGMTLVPLDEKRKRRLETHIAEVTRAVVYGNVMTALVQGPGTGANTAKSVVADGLRHYFDHRPDVLATGPVQNP